MRPFTIGIDVGGTDLKAARVGVDGALEGFIKRPSGAAVSAQACYDAIRAARDTLVAGGGEPRGIGIGIPGVIDPERGVLVGATPNLPHWRDEPLRDSLRDLLGAPIAIDNDANFAALGEARHGAARGARLALMITVGTGVGCGIVVGGELLRGVTGGAGELGHVALGDGRLPCGCEVESCVEPEMSASGLVRLAAEAGLDAPDAAAVFAAAAGGHAEANAWIDRMADRLGAVVGTAVNLLNPDVVVIGGGVAKAGARLVDPVRAAVARYALESHRRGLRIVPAALGERAGVVGAGVAARTI